MKTSEVGNVKTTFSFRTRFLETEGTVLPPLLLGFPLKSTLEGDSRLSVLPNRAFLPQGKAQAGILPSDSHQGL
jgi:hypothetical protein